MKSIIKSFTVASLMFLLSCNTSEKKAESKMAENQEAVKIDPSTLAMKTDPVCGMSVAGEVADTLSYNGKLYGFCCKEDKEAFKSDPEKYLTTK